jgi:hypothetical protein
MYSHKPKHQIKKYNLFALAEKQPRKIHHMFPFLTVSKPIQINYYILWNFVIAFLKWSFTYVLELYQDQTIIFEC